MALNFPNPNTIQTYTNAGITWTWNPTLGVWSTEGNTSDNEFLSKVNDDTAAGAITFEGQTTHEAGVSVTGGDKTEIVNGFVNIPSNNAINIISDSDTVANFKQAEIGIGGLASAGRDVTIRNQYIDTNETGLFVVKDGNGNGTHIGAITTQLNLTNNATATAYGLELTCSNINTGNSSSGDIYGAFVSSNLGAYTGSGKTYGYYSQLNTSARTTYAFFAAGDAPNYFAGKIIGPSGANFGEGNPGNGDYRLINVVG